MIFLGLGSNLSSSFGDRFKNIYLALNYLKQYNIEIFKKSSFYETPSQPNNHDPKFINLVISIKTDLSPLDLMSKLILIEEKLERKRNQKNDPRTCDIDIIDYKSQILNFKYNNEQLTIPHDKLIFRNFVLFPLKEISPRWKHPKTGENINVLIKNLTEDQKNSILMVKKN